MYYGFDGLMGMSTCGVQYRQRHDCHTQVPSSARQFHGERHATMARRWPLENSFKLWVGRRQGFIGVLSNAARRLYARRGVKSGPVLTLSWLTAVT